MLFSAGRCCKLQFVVMVAVAAAAAAAAVVVVVVEILHHPVRQKGE